MRRAISRPPSPRRPALPRSTPDWPAPDRSAPTRPTPTRPTLPRSTARLRALTLSLLLASGCSWGAPTGRVLPFGGYGLPDRVFLSGRLLEDPLPPAQPAEGSLSRLWRSLEALESDEIEGAQVEATLQGHRLSGRSDDEGIFELEARDLSPPLTPGRGRAELSITTGAGHRFRGAVPYWILRPGGALVISDLDDTVIDSQVHNKLRLLGRTLFGDETTIRPVPGAIEAWRRAAAAGATFFYLSGSPINLLDRFHRFFARAGLPLGVFSLKNLGDDPLFSQLSYKRDRAARLLERLPGVRVLWVGDSGEADPEVYRALQAQHRAQLCAALIREVRPEDRRPRRAAGLHWRARYTPDSLSALLSAGGPCAPSHREE